MKLVYKTTSKRFLLFDTMTEVKEEYVFEEPGTRSVVSNEAWCCFLNKHFMGIEPVYLNKWADQIDTNFIRERWVGDDAVHNGIQIKFLRR